ncbi:MAG: hypothetical protein H7836_07515 [Magnetococcus sp. YQC-3]
MKKSLVLGAAALATLLMAAPQASQAGEVKMGGYYMFRMQDTDNTIIRATGNNDDTRYWAHRVQLNMDFIQDKTTHAHLVTRILDSNTLQGGDSNISNSSSSNNSGTTLGQIRPGASAAIGGGDFNIRKAWLETDMWGVGVKVGNMPLSMNDNILMSTSDDTGYGALVLSKTFGDVSAVLGDIRLREGNIVGASTGVGARNAAWTGTYFVPALLDAANTTVAAATAAADAAAAAAGAGTVAQGSLDDNEDIYVLSLFGKVQHVNYQVTGAYLRTENDSAISNYLNGLSGGNRNARDGWVGLTLNTMLGGVDVTGTAIYETGFDGVGNTERTLATTAMQTQLAAGGNAANAAINNSVYSHGINAQRMDDSGVLLALRLKGELPALAQGAKWNAYGVYASENYTNITNDEMGWSQTWDMGGPGAQDLMKFWATAAGASPSENMWAVGAGLSVPVQGWTINPMIDYAHVVEDRTSRVNGTSTDYRTTSAWGGALQVSTKLNPATTFAITGVVVDPNDEGNSLMNTGAANATDTLHTIEASLKMTF